MRNLFNTRNIFKKSIAIDDSAYQGPNIISIPILTGVAIFASFASVVLIWSTTYSMPISISGKGLIHRKSRLSSVKAKSNGIIKNIFARNGDIVKANQNLSDLYNNNKIVESNAAEKVRKIAEANSLQTNSKIPIELKKQILSLTELLKTTKNTIKKQEVILSKQEENLKKYRLLSKQGYLSEVELIQYTEKAISFQKMIGKSKGDFNKLLAQKASTERKLSSAILSANKSVVHAEKDSETSSNNLKAARNMKSPIDGKVIQVGKWIGDTVMEGDELFVLSPVEGKLNGTFLVDSSVVGKIKVGDRVLISPTSTPSARYGYINGKVISFSTFPTDEGTFGAFIGSSLMAKTVFKSELPKSPIIVQVSLNYSGSNLEWTGSNGPSWSIDSGELATIKVIYEERLPISYVSPLIRELTGISQFE